MAVCDDAHRQFDSLANGDGQIGEMPPWTHVTGKTFWWVFGGPYEGLPTAWGTFHERGQAVGIRPAGPPGDLYVCDPTDHEDDPERLLTILWIPVE